MTTLTTAATITSPNSGAINVTGSTGTTGTTTGTALEAGWVDGEPALELLDEVPGAISLIAPSSASPLATTTWRSS